MIERIPKTHRYRVAHFRFRVVLFFTRTHIPLAARMPSDWRSRDLGISRSVIPGTA